MCMCLLHKYTCLPYTLSLILPVFTDSKTKIHKISLFLQSQKIASGTIIMLRCSIASSCNACHRVTASMLFFIALPAPISTLDTSTHQLRYQTTKVSKCDELLCFGEYSKTLSWCWFTYNAVLHWYMYIVAISHELGLNASIHR